MELNAKETHCMARLLQSMVYTDSLLGCCPFCKYQCFKDEGSNNHIYFYRVLLKQLTEAAGVNLKPGVKAVANKQFPFKRFLENSNEDIQKFFQSYFEQHIAEE